MRGSGSVLFMLVLALGMHIQSGIAGNDEGRRQAAPNVPGGSAGDGLVAYYPFNGNAQDASGNVYHGTVHGATLTTDRFGIPNAAYAFNGSTNYIEVANSAELNPTNAITYAGWFQSNTANQFGTIVSKGNDQQVGYYVARLHPAPTNMGFAFLFSEDQGTLTSVNASDVPIAVDQWYHFAVTYDGTTARSYINGVLRNTNVVTRTLGSNQGPLSIGRHPLGGYTYHFSGKIDDIRLYNTALTEDEVVALYTATPGSTQNIWVQTSGPGVGNDVRALAIDSHGNLLAGTWSSGGTVWRTSDRGATWLQLGIIPDSDPVVAIALNAQDHIFLDVFTKGVYRSTDNGATWYLKVDGITNYRLRGLAVDKAGVIWAGSEDGIYRSTNNGDSWTNVLPGFYGQLFQDSTGAIVASTGTGTKINRTTNGGSTWSEVPVTSGVGLNGIHPSGDYYGNDADGGLWRSTDYGASWNSLHNPVKWSVGHTTAYTFGLNGDIYFARDGDATGIMRSTDLGATWEIINSGLTTTRVIPLLAHPDGYVYAGTYGQGVFRTNQPAVSGKLIVAIVRNHPSRPPIGTGARAELYSSNGTPVAFARSDSNSMITFTGVPIGSGYYYRVFFKGSSPSGELFVGEKGCPPIEEGQPTEDGFIPMAPYIESLAVFIDSTNEALTFGTAKVIQAGTRLRFEMQIQNPSVGGSLPASLSATVLLDRDTLGVYDQKIVIDAGDLGTGQSKKVVAFYEPAVAGAYHVSAALTATTIHYASQLTDATGWLLPAFHVEGGMTATVPWHVTNTGASHTVVIPLSATVRINGAPIGAGDYVGVFYDSAGVPACAGMERWIGSANIGVSVFGDDPTTPVKDGMLAGEVFRWKVYRASQGLAFDVAASYAPVSGIITHTNAYALNGISKLDSLVGPATSQCLELRRGWSLIASTIAPVNTQLDSVLRPVLADVILVKNGAQQVFLPSIPVNGIGPWVPTEGYQIKMANARSLCFQGQRMMPWPASVTISAGWGLLPYLRETEMSVMTALGTIAADILIVKDQDGKAYLPGAGVNGIGMMKPGQAYQVKMAAGRTLDYPAVWTVPAEDPPEDGLTALRATQVAPAWYFTNTGTNHTIIVPLSAAPTINGVPLSAGDYIGVFYDSSSTKACAGFEQWNGASNLGIAAFGDDPTTTPKEGFAAGERIQFRIWRKSDGVSFVAASSYVSPGSMGGLVTDSADYSPNGISAVATLRGSLTGAGSQQEPLTFSLLQNYPNPFNPSTTIGYSLAQSARVELSVLTPLGQTVRVLVQQHQGPGEYRVNFDAAGLASGVYFYRLRAGEFVQIRRLTLLR